MTEGLGNTNLPTSLKRAYYITELQSFHSVVGIIIYFFYIASLIRLNKNCHIGSDHVFNLFASVMSCYSRLTTCTLFFVWLYILCSADHTTQNNCFMRSFPFDRDCLPSLFTDCRIVFSHFSHLSLSRLLWSTFFFSSLNYAVTEVPLPLLMSWTLARSGSLL